MGYLVTLWVVVLTEMMKIMYVFIVDYFIVPLISLLYFCSFFLYLLCLSMIRFLICFHNFFVYALQFRFLHTWNIKQKEETKSNDNSYTFLKKQPFWNYIIILVYFFIFLVSNIKIGTSYRIIAIKTFMLYQLYTSKNLF